MKLSKYLIILFLLPLKLVAQDITGLWIGYLHNDTTNLNLHYEIVISEENGKYSGYSYTNFFVDNKYYYGVKSIKISYKNGKISLEDVELIDNDYPFDPPKGVKQVTNLDYSNDGTKDLFTGRFTTTRTRQYGRPVVGSVVLERKTDYTNNKLLAVLRNLDKASSLSFLMPKEEPVAIAPPKKQDEPVVIAQHAKKQEPVIAKPDPVKELTKRKVETIQTVYFTSDSLRLELFDNGYVDGDSVSLILNGVVLLEHQRLSEKAISKTIAVPTDSLNLVMFAENLGSITPNSGLLIIYDGKEKHQLFFSGDLNTNAAIILKRKR
jgi:hypothetical protein